MEATTLHPTLLSAARSFIRKSAGTAVLVIVPLAAVALAPEAKGQVTLSVPSSGSFSGLFFSHGSTNSSGFFSSQLPPLGDITGVKMGLASGG